jgi:beta-xylosidase
MLFNALVTEYMHVCACTPCCCACANAARPAHQAYVLWFRWLNATGPSLSDDATLYLTATAPAVDGPYTLANVNVPMFWNNSADDNLFVDDDGTGYLVHTCRSCGTHIVVERLSADFTYSLGATDPTARSDLVGPGGTEAPALFKAQGLYYLTMGALCCYCTQGAPALVYVAKAPLGPYQPMGSLGNQTGSQQVRRWARGARAVCVSALTRARV